MSQEGHPKETRTNGVGANFDIDRELTGSQDNGEYVDAQNLRVTSARGNKQAAEKIRGEEIEHPSNNVPGDWFCLDSFSVNEKKIEIYVDENDAQPPLVRIDGVIVGQSSDMPWLRSFPTQHDINENCLGGEFFITDFNTAPMIFNVQDMLDSLTLDPTKYFSNFNPSLYTVNLDAPIDIPVFRELVNLGGGGGLPVGQYQYSLRYVTDEGDRTNWGPLTPTIPVVQSLSDASSQYPNSKTYGGPANLSAATSYGIKLRFRITNLVNYDSIEIRRISYNAAQGVDIIPGGEIIARLAVSPGEISIREFIDPVESNVTDTLADNEETNELSFIEKAKGIRYHDKRLVLMNVETASRDSNLVFEEFNGKKILPIVQALGKAGHNDPYNHTYYKNNPSGERYSYAVNLFDSVGGRGFAIPHPDLENVQTPNRRVEADADSQLLSYGGMATAANTASGVTPTFEVFDLEDALIKTDICSFKNILNDGSKSSGAVNVNGCPDPGFGALVEGNEIGYKPYKPTDANDTTDGHNYLVNTNVDPTNDGTTRAYNPRGFAPNYFSKGVALAGISNFPSWAKAFSVVRTRPADRVVCQGIGMYSLNPGDFNAIGNASTANKDLKKVWFHSPDIEAGLVNQATIDDIANNPQNYSVQVVSPLGFFSEVYNFEENTVADARDRIVDMITYARVLHDEGQINTGEQGTMGVGALGNRYVAYNRYRNTGDAAGGGIFAVPEGGDRLIGVQGITSITEGRGNYYQLDLSEFLYNNQFTGGTGNNNFDDAGMRAFTEPMYIINIVQDGRTVVDQNIDPYVGTGHWQKLESIVGQGNGGSGQSFPLVDERWEDCIPDLSSSGPRAADEVFVYLVDINGNQETYMDVTFLTPAQVNAIISDIVTNGFYLAGTGAQVTGLYTHTNTDDRDFTIEFNVSSYFPSADQQVIVKYDNRRPVRVFGGDSTIGETIFSPIDKEADANDDADTTQFVMNIGFPFRKYTVNARHYIIARTTGLNKIQDANKGSLGYIRQMCLMYACESRISTHFAHNIDAPDQYFPLTHYVMRPNRFDDGSFAGGDDAVIAADNNMFVDYFEDYPLEYNSWKFGGLRFLQQYNIDYSSRGPLEYFSKPDFGFEEQNKFCTGVFFSLPRAINQQDSPGLKTFLTLNRFDIDDDSGEIKKAYDTRTGSKGENLYAITNKGVCLLLTKKAILSNISADDLTVTASDSFIGGQYWIERNIGSNDEMWRGMAEDTIEIPQEGGNLHVDALYFPNQRSVYRLMENRVMDILRGTNYYARVNPVLSRIRPGYQDHLAGVFNRTNNEYWLQINTQPIIEFDPLIGMLPEEKRVFVFAQSTNRWVGTFTYEFDNYQFVDNDIYGSKDLETYKLERGFIINGQPIEAFLIQNYSPAQAIEKEFIEIQVNTGTRRTMKPSRIEFYNADGTLLCALDEATFGPLYLKQKDGWTQQIPRKDLAVSVNRDRIQERLLICKIIHNFEEDFKIVDTVVQFKPLK